MHLGATVHQWLLIVRILLKPKSGRKDEACRADGRGKLLEIHSKGSESNVVDNFPGFPLFSSEASPERYIQGSCRNILQIKVLNWNQFKDEYFYY